MQKRAIKKIAIHYKTEPKTDRKIEKYTITSDTFDDLFEKDPARIIQGYNEPLIGAITDLHYHHAIEVGYCYSGNGIFLIDGESLPFSAPCATIIYPGQVHKACSLGSKSSKWLFLTFRKEGLPDLNVFSSQNVAGNLLHKEPDDVTDHNPNNAMEHELDVTNHIPDNAMEHDLNDVINPQSCLIRDPSILRLVSEVARETDQKEEGYDACIRALLAATLICHGRVSKEKVNVTGKFKMGNNVNMERLYPLMQFISQQYATDLSSEQLAELVFVHPATLREWFQEALGISPMQYVHRIRISAACSLLLGTDKPVLDISIETGYRSMSSFNRQFLSKCGCSPMQYRKSGVHSI